MNDRVARVAEAIKESSIRFKAWSNESASDECRAEFYRQVSIAACQAYRNQNVATNVFPATSV